MKKYFLFLITLVAAVELTITTSQVVIELDTYPYDFYTTGQAITIKFKNGPGNPKDWIGIYQEGIQPGSTTPLTYWYYVDGTKLALTGKASGSVTFSQGIAIPGKYRAFMFENDGYRPLISEIIEVVPKRYEPN
jgi:hypothetical protein